MRIVFLNKLNRLWIEKINRLRDEFADVVFVSDFKNVDQEIETANGLVTTAAPLDLLQKSPHLEIVFFPYAGPDALPWEYLRQQHIRISNVHGNAFSVAERACALALSFYGNIIEYHHDLKRSRWHGIWAAKPSIGDTWSSIRGRTCAILGTGAIGQCLARFLKTFECRVIGFKKRPVDEPPLDFDQITYDLREALTKSELIFVTLPLTKDTRGLISAEILMQLHGKFVVNVGRGKVIDEEGLYRSLKGGILKGAAIDAWYEYPQPGQADVAPSQYPFHELPNVILSPHIAGFTPRMVKENIAQTIENIRAYILSGNPNSEVDLDLMY